MRSWRRNIVIGISCLLITINLVGCSGDSSEVPPTQPAIEEAVVEEREEIVEPAPPYTEPVYPNPEVVVESTYEDVTLTWDWHEELVDGYRIYYANISFYDEPLTVYIEDVGYDNYHTIFNLDPKLTWFFVATAYLGTTESGYSNEVVW